MQELDNKSYFRELTLGRYSRCSFYVLLSTFCVLLLSFIFVPYLAAKVSATNLADANVRWGVVSLTLDPDYDAAHPENSQTAVQTEGHGDIRFGDLVPTENNIAASGNSYGTLKVLKKTIGITSSGKYYSVYLSTSSNDNNLSLELTGGSRDSAIYIPAIEASFASPAGFADSGWGFAVPGVDTDSDAIPDAPSTFVVPALVGQQIGAQTTTAGASATYSNTKWSGVPSSDSPQLIWKNHAQGTAGEEYGFGIYLDDQNVSRTGDTTHNHFDIYYAVAVDTDVLAGTYSNNIIYTALASASSLDSVSTNLMHSLSAGGTNDIVTLRFDLTQSTITLNASDIKVTLVPHSVMVANDYDALNFDINELGEATTPGYLNCPIVADSLVVNGYVELQCAMPASAPENGSGNGGYDFWVHVNGYNYNYISLDTKTVASTPVPYPSFTYTGLQSELPSGTLTRKDGSTTIPADPRYSSASGADNHIVNEMQQMTAGVCSNTNIWNNQTGANARIYNYTGFTRLVADVADDDDDPETDPNADTLAALTLEANAALGVGTFALTDTRDNKDYLVRRLADGNCWMVQNLDLELFLLQ